MPQQIATSSETSVRIDGDSVRRPLGAAEGARLARLYWRSAVRSSLRLVAVDGDALGPVRLALIWRRGPALLSFGAAQVAAAGDGVTVTFPIVGGLAAAVPEGELVLAVEDDGEGARISVRVVGYTPRFARPRTAGRLAARGYAAAQRVVHGWVTSRYLAELARELA
jgi:hypothetical protein